MFSYTIHLVCGPVQFVSQICSLGGLEALLLDLCCPCDGLVSSSVFTQPFIHALLAGISSTHLIALIRE